MDTRLTILPFVTVALLGGCGGSPTADEACTASAQAQCARRAACSNGFLISRTYGDMSSCVAQLHDVCVSALAAPATGNSPAAVQDCADAYPSISCADYLDNNPPPVCQTKVGTLATGAACRFAAQCASTFCSVITGAECGTCGPLPTVGSACNGTGATAGCGGHSLECVGADVTTGSPGTCQMFVASGATCDTMHRCGTGLSCTPVGAMATGRTCQPAGSAAGVACGGASNAGCDNDRGFYCNGMSHTCQPFGLVAAGTTCGLGTDGNFADCSGGGDCMGYTTATPSGTCRAVAAEGAACDREAGPFCAASASCVMSSASGTAGTCQTPSATTCH